MTVEAANDLVLLFGGSVEEMTGQVWFRVEGRDLVWATSWGVSTRLIGALIILLLISLTLKIQKVEQFNIVYAAERPHRPEDTHYAYNFFAHYDRAIGFLVRPRATAFWNAVVEWSHTTASSLRIFYNGNGQTYALFIVMYFVAMFLLNGGLAL